MVGSLLFSHVVRPARGMREAKNQDAKVQQKVLRNTLRAAPDCCRMYAGREEGAGYPTTGMYVSVVNPSDTSTEDR